MSREQSNLSFKMSYNLQVVKYSMPCHNAKIKAPRVVSAITLAQLNCYEDESEWAGQVSHT